MRLFLQKGPQAIAIEKLMRLAGYIYIVDRKFGKDSYTRPLGNYHYPRFHAYVEISADSLIINLHLDQKQASYQGFKRHSGEYDGVNVQAEIARLRQLAIASGFLEINQVPRATIQRVTESSKRQAKRDPAISSLQSGDYHQAANRFVAKKSWWQKIFGV